jgi:predicted secreted protein
MKNKFNHPDRRSKKFIFIPFCLICQAFQARGIVRFGFTSKINPIVEEILRHDVNIVQMPCPESQLRGYEQGLKRNPKGFKEYGADQEFISLCEKLSSEVAGQIKAIVTNGFEVVAILGMEYSPSCSTSLQYTREGTIKKPGHFIALLMAKLKRGGLDIPFIGINRRGINSSVKKIKDLFERMF